MNLRPSHRERRSRRGLRARPEHPMHRTSVAASGPAPGVRPRASGTETQDVALYTCGCGFVFQATVSTSVGCPHCGDTQAW